MLARYQGKGYITEAAQALIEFLFNEGKIRKIVAHCSTENIGSWKVMEKLGFEREAYFKMHTKINGSWFDDYAYGLINPVINQYGH